MNSEKYTQKAAATLQEAQQLAALHYHQELTTKHLALALVKDAEGIMAYLLSQLGLWLMRKRPMAITVNKSHRQADSLAQDILDRKKGGKRR
jgi:ATP-dependent Clp protease ATP-binding subunit ClpA